MRFLKLNAHCPASGFAVHDDCLYYCPDGNPSQIIACNLSNGATKLLQSECAGLTASVLSAEDQLYMRYSDYSERRMIAKLDVCLGPRRALISANHQLKCGKMQQLSPSLFDINSQTYCLQNNKSYSIPDIDERSPRFIYKGQICCITQKCGKVFFNSFPLDNQSNMKSVEVKVFADVKDALLSPHNQTHVFNHTAYISLWADDGTAASFRLLKMQLREETLEDVTYMLENTEDLDRIFCAVQDSQSLYYSATNRKANGATYTLWRLAIPPTSATDVKQDMPEPQLHQKPRSKPDVITIEATLKVGSEESPKLHKVIEVDQSSRTFLSSVIEEIFYKDTNWHESECSALIEKKNVGSKNYESVLTDYRATVCEESTEYKITFYDASTISRRFLPKAAMHLSSRNTRTNVGFAFQIAGKGLSVHKDISETSEAEEMKEREPPMKTYTRRMFKSMK
ncbi:hypothetical protein QR680_004099 [Steinernema hermaphroditum]|uniref:Uncharacterized protein n=1 Tax=Steinernema hermaphroditum TaxID=289476 RepID=A0AA39HPV7_9BILA|nr:hypothetical protein QR680_004099 [Steinernema hermaphroditum]